MSHLAKLLQTSDHFQAIVNPAIVAIQAYASAVYGAETIETISTVRAANEDLQNIPTVKELADNIVSAWFAVIAADEKEIAQSNSRSHGWLNSGN